MKNILKKKRNLLNKMSSKLKDAQLFFKNLLQKRVKNESEYKEYSINFTLDLLDYDLYDEDIKKVTNLIVDTDKFTSLLIRLSNTLTNSGTLSRLLRKISLKRQFTSLSFFIKYLNDDLLSIFIDFIGKLENTLTTLEITIKYTDIKKEGEIVKRILESLLKNNNSGITNLTFKECRFNTEENLNLLNKLIEKNKNKLKQLILCKRRIFDDNFTPNISSLTRVDLLNCNLSSVKYIPIEILNLAFNNIGKYGLESIVENLKKKSCTLKKLNLSYNYLGNEGSLILSECLKENKSLASLNLTGNNILNEGAIYFANNLLSKYNTTLKKLNFKDNSINSKGIIQFCSILKNEPSDRFSKIDFSVNYLDDEGLSDYGYFISKFPNIKTIVLSNKLSKHSLNNFFIYCQNLSNLKKINLTQVNLTYESTKQFNELLMNNKNIEKLIIATNRALGSDGIVDICPGIQHNLKISQLTLNACHIGDEGAEALANALFKNIDIKDINLDDNKIGIKGLKALSEKVLGKVSLIRINLAHNLIDEEGGIYIGKSLETSNGLQYLILNSNKLKDKGCIEITKGLEKNNSLIELHLDNNEITNIGINALSKVLSKKENIMFLGLSTNEITEINDDFNALFDWLKIIKIADNPLYPAAIIKLFHGTANNRLFKKLRFKSNDIFIFKSIGENNNLKVFDLSYNDKINLSLIKNILFLKNISKLSISRNDIHDKDIQRFVQYIKEYKSPLKELYIQSNFIGIEGSLSIAELIKDNEYLKILNLADNPLQSEGINNICDSITNNKNVLSELLINYTKCNDFSVSKIVNMLKRNKNLSVLTLIGNKFTNKGVDMILSTLRMNNTLKQISLGNNYLNSNAFINLADYLSFNKSLLILEIKSSKLKDEILKKLSKILLHNKTLLNLYLVDNLLSYEGIVSLGQHLNKSKSINQIKVLLNAERNEEPIIKSSNPHIIFN